MAKVRNGRNQKRVRRKPVRALARLLHHTISKQPLQCRVPPDPPSLCRRSEGHLKLQLDFLFNSTTPQPAPADAWTYGNLNLPAYRFIVNDGGTHLEGFEISCYDIAQLISAVIGQCTPDRQLEFSIEKVQLWGPISTPTRFATSSLRVDVGNNTNSTLVQDVGTAVRRPRCGITLPFRVWYTATDSYSPIAVALDTTKPFVDKTRWSTTTSYNLGTMHLTVHYRLSAVDFNYNTPKPGCPAAEGAAPGARKRRSLFPHGPEPHN